MLIELRLPMPPSVNGLFATNKRTGGRFKSKLYRRWQANAGWSLQAQRVPAMTEQVDISIHLPDARSRRADADNYAKPILDLLVKHGVLKDDRGTYVREVSVRWSRREDVGVFVRTAE